MGSGWRLLALGLSLRGVVRSVEAGSLDLARSVPSFGVARSMVSTLGRPRLSLATVVALSLSLQGRGRTRSEKDGEGGLRECQGLEFDLKEED